MILVAVILAAVLYKKSKSALKKVDKDLDDIDRVQQELGKDMKRGELGFVRGLGWGSGPNFTKHVSIKTC